MINLRTSRRARLVPALLTGLVTLGGLGISMAPAHADTTPCVPLNWPGGATQLCAPGAPQQGGLWESGSDIGGGMNLHIVMPSGGTGMPAIAPGWSTISGPKAGTGPRTTVTCQLGSTATGGWAVSCPVVVPIGSTVGR